MSNGIPTFVKWAGGKTQLLPQYSRFFPSHINRYFEPFLGSGAVYFYLKKHIGIGEAFLSDSNEELVNAYVMVRDRMGELVESLRKRKALHSKAYFYEVRKRDPADLTPLERASRMIYLNKTCFNGLYRVNSKGEFNVPFGDYDNPKILDERNLKEAKSLLGGAHIETTDYKSATKSARRGDFVYFDPPYLPISSTSNFTSYTRSEFGEEEQRKLSKVFAELDRRGCKLMLSNSSHPLVRSLYSDYDISTIRARRAISSLGTGRGRINETLVTNYKTVGLADFA